MGLARESDVGRVSIEMRGREHIGLVDRGALRFVHRGGVAVVEMLVELGIDGNAGFRGAVEFDGEDAGVDAFYHAERAVFDAQSFSLRRKLGRDRTELSRPRSRCRVMSRVARAVYIVGAVLTLPKGCCYDIT